MPAAGKVGFRTVPSGTCSRTGRKAPAFMGSSGHSAAMKGNTA